MPGATACATKNVPRRLVSRTLFQSSQVKSTAGLRTLPPALVTRMSIFPKAASASWAMRRMLGPHLAGRDQLQALGIFAARRARALEADLARHDRLQRNGDVRREVPDQRHAAALAHGGDRAAHGGLDADGLEGRIGAPAFGERPHRGPDVAGAGVDDMGRAELLC